MSNASAVPPLSLSKMWRCCAAARVGYMLMTRDDGSTVRVGACAACLSTFARHFGESSVIRDNPTRRPVKRQTPLQPNRAPRVEPVNVFDDSHAASCSCVECCSAAIDANPWDAAHPADCPCPECSPTERVCDDGCGRLSSRCVC